MQEINGTVTEIQRSSFHDGPGIRTTVFLKGCPLSCAWCHNPESIPALPVVLSYPEKCIGCNMCEKGCFSGARVTVGKEMSVKEVTDEIMSDYEYFGEKGGVTLTGGEPFMQPEFADAIISECKGLGINVAVETSMIYYYPEILKKADILYIDLKLWDSEQHKKFTGAGNEKIKKNILSADTLGVPIVIHTPVVPTVNADRYNIENIRNFAKGLKSCIGYELLPYHPLGVAKAEAMGKKQQHFETPKKELMEELKLYAEF